MMIWNCIRRIVVLGLVTVLTSVSAFQSMAAVPAEPPAYLKSVTYVSDAWVINFWSTEGDHLEEDLAQIAADGFNSIILVIPWREFQPDTDPVTYNGYAFEKLNQIMEAANDQGLWVELRVSYTWDYYAKENVLNRFRELLGSQKLRQAWLDYVKKIYDTVSVYPNFHGGFMTWEDFWNYMEDATNFGTGTNSVAEADRIGYQDYLKTYYTLDQINEYYKPKKQFTSFSSIYMPDKKSPAYKLLFEFYDDYLIALLHEAQQVFPNLSMEVRLDVDPVNGVDGEKVGAHHFRTFPCGSSTYTSLMYSISMGQENQGERITAAQALEAADRQLNLVKMYNGGKPIFIDQLLYMDGTEEFSHNAQIIDEERNVFITSVAPILKKYSNGYGVWSYWNYTNNPLYNSQFALGTKGWDTSRTSVVQRDGSNQAYLLESGRITQKIGDRITGKTTHNNHVRFTADSDAPVTLKVTMGNVTKEVKINGKGQFDLNFSRLSYDEITFQAEGKVYLDNIQVYNFIQDGQLRDISGGELSSMEALRQLNRAME